MKWKRNNFGWECEFGGHHFLIFSFVFRYKLWSYDVGESWHWTVWGARRAALEHAVSHCLHQIVELQECKLDKDDDS